MEGIGAPYNPVLSTVEDQMMPLALALPVPYTVLEETLVGRIFLPGRIVRLSARQAEIDGAEPVVPLANMKIPVLDDAGEPRAGDVDAKAVTEPGPVGTFRVRFTSVAPERTPLLQSLPGKA